MNYKAIRAFIKVWNPIVDELNEAAEADARFDGGEFSGHSDVVYLEEQRVAGAVAFRFGMSAGDLLQQVRVYHNEQFRKQWEAHGEPSLHPLGLD